MWMRPYETVSVHGCTARKTETGPDPYGLIGTPLFICDVAAPPRQWQDTVIHVPAGCGRELLTSDAFHGAVDMHGLIENDEACAGG